MTPIRQHRTFPAARRRAALLTIALALCAVAALSPVAGRIAAGINLIAVLAAAIGIAALLGFARPVAQRVKRR